MRITIALLLVSFLITSCSSSKMQLKVIVPGKQSSTIALYAISNQDTTQISRKNDSIFYDKKYLLKRIIFVSIDNKIIKLGKLDKRITSVDIMYDARAKNECLVYHKILGDMIEDSFNLTKDCQFFHEVFLYDKATHTRNNTPIHIKKN